MGCSLSNPYLFLVLVPAPAIPYPFFLLLKTVDILPFQVKCVSPLTYIQNSIKILDRLYRDTNRHKSIINPLIKKEMSLSFDCYQQRTEPNGETFLDVYMSLLLSGNKRAALIFSIASTGDVAPFGGELTYNTVTLSVAEDNRTK